MILSPPIYVTSSNINSKTCSNICTLSKTNITSFCLHWSGNKLKPGQDIKTWGYMRGLFNVYLYLTELVELMTCCHYGYRIVEMVKVTITNMLEKTL